MTRQIPIRTSLCVTQPVNQIIDQNARDIQINISIEQEEEMDN